MRVSINSIGRNRKAYNAIKDLKRQLERRDARAGEDDGEGGDGEEGDGEEGDGEESDGEVDGDDEDDEDGDDKDEGDKNNKPKKDDPAVTPKETMASRSSSSQKKVVVLNEIKTAPVTSKKKTKKND